MSNTSSPDVNSTTEATTSTPTTVTTTITTTTHSDNITLHKDTIIGAVVGATAGVAIVVLIICLCCIKRLRSKRKVPPVPPHPFDNVNCERWQPLQLQEPESSVDTSLDSGNGDPMSVVSQDSENSNRDSQDYMLPVTQRWKVIDPVIHSPTNANTDQQTSYFVMCPPSNRMSISPPLLPKVQTHPSQYPAQQRHLPPPCKSSDGYINVDKQTLDISESVLVKDKGNTQGNNNATSIENNTDDDYEQFQLSGNTSHCIQETYNNQEMNNQHQETYTNEEIIHHLQISEPTCQESHRKSSFYENISTLNLAGENRSGPDGGVSIENVQENCPDDLQTPTSYVNVHEFSRVPTTDQSEGQQPSIPKSQSTTHSSKPELKSKKLEKPSTLPKPILGQQKVIGKKVKLAQGNPVTKSKQEQGTRVEPKSEPNQAHIKAKLAHETTANVTHLPGHPAKSGDKAKLTSINSSNQTVTHRPMLHAEHCSKSKGVTNGRNKLIHNVKHEGTNKLLVTKQGRGDVSLTYENTHITAADHDDDDSSAQMSHDDRDNNIYQNCNQLSQSQNDISNSQKQT